MMNVSEYQNLIPGGLRRVLQPPSGTKGTVLVYLIVVVLIFGVLGVTMVSLFTTATSSSATPNDTRRANYIFEAAMRYAFSELRNEGFATGTVNDLNSNTYTLDPTGSFSFNIFGPWFDSESEQLDKNSDYDFRLKVAEGEIPTNYSIPAGPPYLSIVNFEYTDISISQSSAEIKGYSKIDSTTLDLTLRDDFSAGKNERVCLAVHPSSDQPSIPMGGTLKVDFAAKDVFPRYNGAIEINRQTYFYTERDDTAGNGNWVELKKLSKPPESPAPFSVTTTDYVILSPRNHLVIPSATMDTVSIGGKIDDAVNIYDATTPPAMFRKPDIEFAEEPDLDTSLTQKETDSGFINVDNTEKTVNIGGGGSTSDEFGGVWYNEDKAIGGDPNTCQVGKCEFGLGMRAFFTLDYAGDGEGLTFVLLNGALNNHTSIGGDIDLAELIGYAGDSRKVTNPTVGSDYLDGTGNGLRPPKIAVEFDTRTDNGNFQYCNPVASSDPADSQQDSRNDPLSADRDAVQYVFWGFDPTLFIPCRADNPTYDDNRHNAGESETNWAKSGLGLVRSTPAVTDDGSVIYIGSDDSNLYAVNSDSTIEWTFTDPGDAVRSSPAIGDEGIIYVGSDDGHLYAINPNGSLKWTYPSPPGFIGAVRTSPVIDNKGDGNAANDIIYVGSDDGNFYALGSNGNKLWDFTASGPISLGRAAFDPTGQKIYISDRSHSLYSLNIADRVAGNPFPQVLNGEWTKNLIDANEYMPGVDPNNGAIYTDASGNLLRALNPLDGSNKWTILNTGDIDSTPVVGAGGTIYFGTDFAKLVAANPDGTVKWEFTIPSGDDVDTTPAIAPDGTILIVSNDGNLYAINLDGTEKWKFPIPVSPVENSGVPNSSPTVGNNNVVYVGSSDTNLYAINDFAEPPNVKEKFVTSRDDGSNDRVAEEIVTLDAGNKEDWLRGAAAIGPWAVRMEVMRSDTVNAGGKYEYTLHAWVRQCNAIDCSDVLGTFYQDTRIQYNTTSQRPVHLEQTVELIPADHTQFDRFLFGFTGALVASDDQSALINYFQLSFIRPNDPFILTDEDWPAP